MANKVAATIFASRVGVALPVLGGKRGPKETYPFEKLVAPAPIFQIEQELDGKGKPKTDKDGNFIYKQNEDGSWKLATDANGLPIPVIDPATNEQAINYDSFAVNGRSKKQIASTLHTARERFVGTPAEIKNEKTGKMEKNFTRDFVAVEMDPAVDPDGASIRVFRIK